MRIVGGKYGSRKLAGPPAGNFRPTSDRVREALFNVLGPRIQGASFADVYAGSGAVGIEALSRGAARVVWVECSGTACWTVRKNLQTLEGEAGGGVFQKKAGSWAVGNTDRFDVVFADPPYELAVEQVLAELAAAPLLAPGGLLVLEHSRRQAAPESSGRLKLKNSRKYGDTVLSFYEEIEG